MENLTYKLNNLKERKKELEEVVSKSFQTSEELERYYQKNKNYFDEYDSIFKEIHQIEWELMTPEQQARAKEVEYLVKLKTGQIKK